MSFPKSFSPLFCILLAALVLIDGALMAGPESKHDPVLQSDHGDHVHDHDHDHDHGHHHGHKHSHDHGPNHDSAHRHKEGHGHVAPHGGALSAIEGCGLGHVEAKVEGSTLTLWFLDGGSATSRSVPVDEARFPLSLVGPDGKRFELTMLPDPMRLAGETGTRCSRFVARSSALEGLSRFRAFGWVRFKGKMRALRIDYPQGYDPDHAHRHQESEDACGVASGTAHSH